jgi:hypothetical protein
MRPTLRLAVLIGCAAAGSAGGLAAQVLGLPVRNAGVATGLELGADVGFPSGAAGEGVAFGATGALGLGPLGITLSVATWDPAGPAGSRSSVGGTANLKVFGGPLVPLSITLQGGLARSSRDVSAGSEETTTHVPVGLGFALMIPNPAFSLKPWIAPRLDVSRTSVNGAADTDTDFGLSAGIDVGFLSGLGIRAMYDRVQQGGGVTPSIVSVGISYGIRVGL